MPAFRRRATALAILLLAALGPGPLGPGPAGAATLGYAGIYAFGDSLTDNQNAYRWSGGREPKSPPYWNGRFAEGRNWYDIVAAAFRAEGAETRNYAFGGGKAVTDRDVLPDLHIQRRVFQNTITPKRNSLVTVWAGGNDVMPRVGKANVVSVARKAADEVVRAVKSLLSNRVNAAVVFNLGDLARLPRFVNADAAIRASATSGTLAYNTRLATGLAELRAKGRTIHEIDVFGFLNAVVADPSAYGIDNLTRPCIVDDKARCTAAEMARSAFIDRTHPGATLHAHLAALVLGQLSAGQGVMRVSAFSAEAGVAPAAVPLPPAGVLLLAGAGGLVLLRRRRAA